MTLSYCKALVSQVAIVIDYFNNNQMFRNLMRPTRNKTYTHFRLDKPKANILMETERFVNLNSQ